MGDDDTLAWGRRYLLCSPDHLGRGTGTPGDPTGHDEPEPDLALARQQWDRLRAELESAGAEVLTRDSVAGLPDMSFAMNHGLVDGDRAVVSRFRPAQRAAEQPESARWFATHGFQLVEPDAAPAERWEAGEAFLCGDRLLTSHGVRSTLGGWEAVAAALRVRIEPLRLTGGLYYHLDTCYCPLGPGRAMLAPAAFDEDSFERLRALHDDVLLLEEDEAHAWVANSCVVGRRLVMPACPPRVADWLTVRGYTYRVVDASAFERDAGVRCLTLPLDTDLAPARLP